MTTSIIHSDVIGSTYVNAIANISRLKATRKFIVKSDVTTTAGVGFESLLNEMKQESGAHPNMTTLLGPIYNNPNLSVDDEGEYGDPIGQVSGAPITHPSNNDCFLLSVECAVLGDQRYLVTGQYGVEQGFSGSAPSFNAIAQYRLGTRSVTYYRQNAYPQNLPLTTSPVAFSEQSNIPVLKVQVPFYTMSSPVTAATVAAVGGLNNSPVTFNGTNFGAGWVRFDGAQMDEYGGALIGGGGQPYKFRGYYAFTVDSYMFQDMRPVINEAGTAWTQIAAQIDVSDATWSYNELWA